MKNEKKLAGEEGKNSDTHRVCKRPGGLREQEAG